MFLGDIVNTLAPSGWGLDRTKAVLSITAVLAPLCLLPDLSALAPMAYVGIMAVLYSSFVVVKRFLDGSCGGAGAFMSSLPFTPGTGQLSAARLSLGTCVLFNMLNTAFMAHTNAVRFYNELEGRTPEKFGKVVAGAFGLSALLYCLVMSAGYATFGSASAGLILENYASSDLLATFARAATGVSIVGSYPLLFTSLRDVLVSTLKSAGDGALGRKCAVASSGAWISMSLGVLAVITALAIAITDAGFVVSVSGASFGAALIFCVPAIIFLAAKSNDKDQNLLPTTKTEMTGVHLLFAFGTIAGLFGTVITCLDTFTTVLK
jgi:sodium-coupled neutral amino acid transporter 11